MSTVRISLLFVLLGLLFCSCSKTDDYVYPNVVSEIMTVSKISKELQVKQDITNKLFTPSNHIYLSSEFNVGDRGFVSIATEETPLLDGSTGVMFYECHKVLSKQTPALKQEVLDTLPNDPLRVVSVWRSANYINTRVVLDYFNTPHLLGLYCNQDRSTPDTLRLELRHGRNGDKPGTEARSYASFSIDSVMNLHPSAVISVHINSTNYGNKEWVME